MKPSPLRFVFSLVSLGIALLPASTALAAPPPGIPDGWSDGYVYANSIRIHYYHAVPAQGKPVMVMVHGLSDIGLSWTTLTWKLQGAYDIYMVDTRGHGLSDPFMPGDDADTLVKDLVAFVGAMKFEKPILMGHSMGAATVMKLGAEHPDLAKAIIMLDPILRPFGPPPPAAGLPVLGALEKAVPWRVHTGGAGGHVGRHESWRLAGEDHGAGADLESRRRS